MLSTGFNWRTSLAIIAIAIVSGTIFYSNYLSKKIEADENGKINVWVESLKMKMATNDPYTISLSNKIATENKDIPVIETDEQGNPSGIYLNLDSNKVKKDTGYLRKMAIRFKSQHDPIKVEISNNPPMYNFYYYGDSILQNEVRFYPIIQLLIVALFIIVILITISVRNKSAQNQVWVGMAKETAHQLGTPITSLQGWVTILQEQADTQKIAGEMRKDVERLKLVSDRFGKIGSTPHLELTNLYHQVDSMMNYIKRRSSERVSFSIQSNETDALVMLNPPLFDWVIENLLKNALDAMEGRGSIEIRITHEIASVKIDIKDTGKGILKRNFQQVFKPGFSTKKRGWGLGLSLSKRIIEQYHQGELYIKSSEIGKGTTFRIVLKK